MAYLTSLPGSFWQKNSPSPFAPRGIADITGVLRGHAVAIELKAPGKIDTITEAQELYLARWQGAGGSVLVSDSVPAVRSFVDEVLKVIEPHGEDTIS